MKFYVLGHNPNAPSELVVMTSRAFDTQREAQLYADTVNAYWNPFVVQGMAKC